MWIINDELSHYGVKGMKWGVRREQRREARRQRKQERREAKQKRKFERNYKQNWYKAYNQATDEFNIKIRGINDRYKNDKFDDEFTTKRGQSYVKEVDKMWKTEYSKALKNQFGNDLAKEYIDNAPFMNSYSEYIRK